MFDVGLWYVNDIGKYRVLAVDGDEMSVRYADGRQQVLSVRVQTRIQEGRILRESLPVAASSSWHRGRHGTYKRIGGRAYWTMGFLFERLLRLGANLTTGKATKFEDDYQDVKGVALSHEQDGVSFLRDGANQWGNQGVVRFRARESELRLLEFSSDDNIPYPVSGTDDTWEVKDIKYLFFLLEHGFDLGGSQDKEGIQSKIPSQYRESFEQGVECGLRS